MAEASQAVVGKVGPHDRPRAETENQEAGLPRCWKTDQSTGGRRSGCLGLKFTARQDLNRELEQLESRSLDYTLNIGAG